MKHPVIETKQRGADMHYPQCSSCVCIFYLSVITGATHCGQFWAISSRYYFFPMLYFHSCLHAWLTKLTGPDSWTWLKMAMFMREGKWEGVMPLPPNYFFVNSYDLKSMSFKFGNDILITFEMPRVTYIMLFWKINILLYSVHLLQRSLTNPKDFSILN